MAAKISENSKVAIRNIRRDGIEKIKKLEKEKEIGQDDAKKFQDVIEQISSNKINEIEGIFNSKEDDLKKDLNKVKSSKYPKRKLKHIALIMDGNGRWAKKIILQKKRSRSRSY